VEIFDPKTNMWVDAPALKDQRAGQIAQLLNDGRVLIAGGYTAFNQIPTDGTAVIYDPTTDTWCETGPMTSPRFLSEAVILPNGEVLVAGGVVISSDPPAISNAVEIYDPRTSTWRTAASLSQPRIGFILRTISNGRVIAIAGSSDWDSYWTQDSFVHEIEYLAPSAKEWRVIANLPEPSAFGAGVQLKEGLIWISGGQVENRALDKTWFIKMPPLKRERSRTS
jgi:N-acetylneuraminic acid mutarotase